jgi:hypothetical protein
MTRFENNGEEDLTGYGLKYAAKTQLKDAVK